ncbi:Putative NAD-dependent epimerase/dehydratase, NAD(P)-binding domain superfamily [Colletotrichum destructivum]|uniref:NAD-dependent epimerase/dehydratase, NAD(P)-binding domain superfamily n=1 Tax=Colletotrichum destructivum TaxID=34406 RepID=A0AAX4I7J7_9PEZI|nr:Putative NAD-dependent epimerase/dehydratase, NAD(P)-binding domain superfamily [Colletotrichum destructivum]
MSQQLLVITGVSGHVGFRVLVEALARGYSVRAIIRKAEQAEHIKNAKSVQPHLKQLDISVIPDLLAPGAFDGALDGASGVVHVASPLPVFSDNLRRDLIDPAIVATLRVLESAANVPSIKRVVITSSVAALLSWEYVMSHDVTTTFTARDTYDPPGPDSVFESPFQAYGASKALAFKATERFVAEKKPSFDVINIMPSMVIGKNELNATKEAVASGTNNNIMAPLLGIDTPSPVLGVSVHVDDVAKAHIDALRPDVPGNRNFICSSGGLQGTEWNSVKSVAAQLFKKEVSDGILPSNGSIPTRPIRLDASDTEEVFGWKFQGFEEQVKSVVQHYLELLEAEESRL